MDLLQFEENLQKHGEAALIRDTVEKIARDYHLVFKMNEYYNAEIFPVKEIVAILQKAELMRLDTVVGEEYGCVKTDYRTYGIFSEAIEKIDSGLRSFLSVTKGLVRYAIHEFGSEDQKQKYLPGLADGSLIGCFGLTGLPGGSDPHRMEMKAHPDINKLHYVLDGEKRWITNGSIADIAVVWASVGRQYNGPQNIRGFIVERGENGFKQKKMEHKRTLRASDTGELYFKDCRISKDAMLPGTEKGISAAYDCLNQARFSIGWGVIGVAKACFGEALKFAKGRTFYDPDSPLPDTLKDMQDARGKFADMGALICDMELRAWRIAELIDKDGGITRKHAQAISYLKWKNVEDARSVAALASGIYASNSLQIEGTTEIGRHEDNLKAVRIYEGTPEVHRLLILGEYFTR